jgi:hypothetical protein
MKCPRQQTVIKKNNVTVPKKCQYYTADAKPKSKSFISVFCPLELDIEKSLMVIRLGSYLLF